MSNRADAIAILQREFGDKVWAALATSYVLAKHRSSRHASQFRSKDERKRMNILSPDPDFSQSLNLSTPSSIDVSHSDTTSQGSSSSLHMSQLTTSSASSQSQSQCSSRARSTVNLTITPFKPPFKAAVRQEMKSCAKRNLAQIFAEEASMHSNTQSQGCFLPAVVEHPTKVHLSTSQSQPTAIEPNKFASTVRDSCEVKVREKLSSKIIIPVSNDVLIDAAPPSYKIGADSVEQNVRATREKLSPVPTPTVTVPISNDELIDTPPSSERSGADSVKQQVLETREKLSPVNTTSVQNDELIDTPPPSEKSVTDSVDQKVCGIREKLSLIPTPTVPISNDELIETAPPSEKSGADSVKQQVAETREKLSHVTTPTVQSYELIDFPPPSKKSGADSVKERVRETRKKLSPIPSHTNDNLIDTPPPTKKPRTFHPPYPKTPAVPKKSGAPTIKTQNTVVVKRPVPVEAKPFNSQKSRAISRPPSSKPFVPGLPIQFLTTRAEREASMRQSQLTSSTSLSRKQSNCADSAVTTGRDKNDASLASQPAIGRKRTTTTVSKEANSVGTESTVTSEEKSVARLTCQSQPAVRARSTVSKERDSEGTESLVIGKEKSVVNLTSQPTIGKRQTSEKRDTERPKSAVIGQEKSVVNLASPPTITTQHTDNVTKEGSSDRTESVMTRRESSAVNLTTQSTVGNQQTPTVTKEGNSITSESSGSNPVPEIGPILLSTETQPNDDFGQDVNRASSSMGATLPPLRKAGSTMRTHSDNIGRSVSGRVNKRASTPAKTPEKRPSHRESSLPRKPSLRRKAISEMNESFHSTLNDSVLGDANMSIASSMGGGRGAKKTEEFWRAKTEEQLEWISRLESGPSPRPAAMAHLMQSWQLLTSTYATFVVRTPKLHSAIEVYIANCIKMYELFVLRGYEEPFKVIFDFVTAVLNRFCASPEHMHELSETWIRSRQALRMVCEHPTNIDIMLGLQAQLSRYQSNFVSTYSFGPATPFDRSMQFAVYVLGQLQDLSARSVRRIEQLERMHFYRLQC